MGQDNLLTNIKFEGRKSNFELLRLVAQYLIVFYHLLLIYIVPFNNAPLFKALELPAHIGVILFVLLSGYFGIKPSSKGFLKLLSIFLIYSLPEICFNVSAAKDIKDIIKSLLFFSHSHFWFIRTYVYLYLLSPVINSYLKSATVRQRWFILLSLFFISIYIGTVGGDITLIDGKNVVNFIFLYIVGNTLLYYKVFFEKISINILILFFLLLNLALVTVYSVSAENLLGSIVWRLSFPYSSPLLLCNSIIFFLIFSKINIQSKAINWMAKSSLAIYLIHSNRPLFIDWDGFTVNPDGGVIGFFMQQCKICASNDFILCILLLFTALIIISIAISIDKLLSPLWQSGNRQFDRIYNFLGF